MSEDLVGLPFGGQDSVPDYDAPRPRGRRQSKHRRPPGRHRNLITALVVVSVLVVLGGGLVYAGSLVNTLIHGADYDGGGTGQVTIQIAQGQTLRQVGDTLVAKGVVKSTRAFTNAAEADTRSTSLQPGTYQLKSHMSAALALALLLDPSSRVQLTFTVTPGMTAKQAFASVAKTTRITVDQLTAAANNASAIGLPDWAKGKVEGFLYPDTYTLQPKDDATAALKMMITQSLKKMNGNGFITKAQAMGKNPYDALIVASLVVGEGIPSDYGKIARVFYNRLNPAAGTNGLLQSDATTIYSREIRGVPRNAELTTAELKDANDPYSTYAHKGLPPTPIGNPDLDALNAAVNPTPGTWIFFVKIDKAGHSGFATTNAEHERNKQLARQNGVL
ncbi:hypothetical protein GCM10009765_13000 [Fodinicola feengrottensis]|uniref:Endolytic murein transglycosylase n=1 Tax=Fodinicola feengrottensis TaxID=435914 RepID=A0ABN2G4E6_9ACTN